MATLIIPEDPTLSISQILKPQPSCIGGLYLGNYRAAQDTPLLQRHKIRAIISLCRSTQFIPPKIPGIRTLWIQIQDSPLSNLLESLPKCVKFIEENIEKGNVFVHCRAGISRSATVIVAYLMVRRNWPLQKAFNRVKQRREIINPNDGFLMQLKVFEEQLTGKHMHRQKYGLSLGKAAKQEFTSKLNKEENIIHNHKKYSMQKLKAIERPLQQINTLLQQNRDKIMRKKSTH